MDLKTAQKLLDRKKADHQKLLGRKDQLMKQLNSLGFNSTSEAQKHLDKSKKELEKLEEEYDQKMDLFTKRYGEWLNETT